MDLQRALEIMKMTLADLQNSNPFSLVKRYNDIETEGEVDEEELADAHEFLSDFLINKDVQKVSIEEKVNVTYPKLRVRMINSGYEAYFDRSLHKKFKANELVKERVTSIEDANTKEVIPIIIPHTCMPERSINICEHSNGELYLVSLIGIGKC